MFNVFELYNDLKKSNIIKPSPLAAKRKRVVDDDLKQAESLAGTLHKEPEELIQPPIEIETLEEYNMKDEDEVFVQRLQNRSRLADPKVTELPPIVDAFKYIESLEPNQQPPWFVQAQQELQEQSKNAPQLFSLSRAYIQPFLVEHDKRDPNSVPCASPHGQCESERLGSFRLRALMFPNQIAVKDRFGYCYLCHLYKTNTMFIQARDQNVSERESFCIHSFTVHVDVPGEYKLEMMLPGPISGNEGLFGPFPAYNRQHYKAINRATDRLRQWVESDALVFRLSQVESQEIEC